MADLRAGAGRARIVLSADSSHDALRVRVLLLDDGEAPLTVAAVDRSVPPEAHAGICRVLAHVTHLDPSRVLICPGGGEGRRVVLSDTVQHAIEDAAAWAAFAARSTCRPACLGEADRLEDDDGRPIAVVLPGAPGAPSADTVEHAHHDELVALLLTEPAAARVGELLDRVRPTDRDPRG
jgi:hypothetical protein